MKLAIFGGTFDPLHTAHLIIANAVRDELSLDRLIFVPCAVPPHKRNAGITSAKHRLKMLELGIADNPFLQCSDVEIRRGGISYTIDTLKYFTDKYALRKPRLFLLIGYDNLVDFHTWKQPDAIQKLATLVVADRPVAINQQNEPDIEDALFPELPMLKISSSQIRRRLKQNKTIKYFVPATVETYIYANHLYID